MMKILTNRQISTVLLLLSLLMSSTTFAQKRDVEGKIVDLNTKEALIGVTVLVKNSHIADVTSINGTFSLFIEPKDTLVVSYIGYKTVEVVVGTRNFIDIALAKDKKMIDEVVVIGYGKTTKKEITGSVASIKGDDLSNGSYTSAAGLLQGKVAGLSITNPNGADPNSSFEILLRGTNTLKAGQGPLIIIDGVVDADMRNINFQEIESFDILKDGSAAAVYGTRGTNGVIIITTKRARSGSTKVEYDGQVNVQMVTRRAIPMTATEFEHTIKNFAPASSGSLYGEDTDWFDAITRTPISHKHSIAVSGGADKFSHRTVLNIEQNQGIQINNDNNKYLFKTNIRQTAMDGWLDLDYNAYMSKRSYTPANYDAFRQAFLHNPTESIYDVSNKESGGYSRITGMDYFNPVAMVNERDETVDVDDAGISVRGTINILPVTGLKWDNFIVYNQQRYESRSYRTSYYPSLIGQDGVASIYNEYSNDIQWESTLNYSNNFGAHSIQALLGYTYQEEMSQYSNMSNHGFDTDSFLTNNIGSGSGLAAGLAEMESYKEANKYIAFFGRVMYNYDEKYLASVSLRRDGSSRFGVNNQWGWFPAVSVGWRVTQENFMQDIDWMDELKVRVGFGVTGNQDFANYKSQILMQAKGYFYNNGEWINTYEPKSNPNPDLTWEKKTEWNIGVDFSILDNRIMGTIDYYNRLTTNLLYDYSVPVPPYDYKVLFTNVGAIKNQGIEFTLNAMPILTRNFRWNSTFIFSKNTNELVKFTNDEFKDGEYKVGWLNTPVGVDCQRLIEGQSLGTFYGPVWMGLDDNGHDILKGSIAGNVPESEWENLGSAYPKFELGWSNVLTYKKWDLSFNLRASIGGKIFNRYAAEFENVNYIGLRNILASWVDDTKFLGPVVYSSKYLEDASYLKLDNLAIGYNFNLKKMMVNRVRLYFSAQNILCITGYSGVDPEVRLAGLTPGIESTSYYPRTATFTCGINMSF